MDTPILAQLDQGVMTITLNRLDKKNALTQAMYADMDKLLQQASSDTEVKSVVIQGSDTCFCAGNDLKDFLEIELENSSVLSFLKTLANFPKPIVAAVSGPAIGIGTTMLLHCDYVLATNQTRFQMPFVHLGLCPEAASSLIFPSLAGHRKSMEYLVLGTPFNAEEAENLGIINHVVLQEQLLSQAAKVAQQFAALPQQASMVSKKLLKQHQQAAVNLQMQSEFEHFGERLNSDEAKQAISAFFK